MSNLVHRQRRCARIVLYTILCLEGSTPEDVCISHYHGLCGLDGFMSCGGRYRSKSLLLSSGLRPYSLMRMLSQVSELPCLTLHIRLVCPQADRKPAKQNSCPWQYKMSLYQRLLTITSDLRGAYPAAFSSVLPRI